MESRFQSPSSDHLVSQNNKTFMSLLPPSEKRYVSRPNYVSQRRSLSRKSTNTARELLIFLRCNILLELQSARSEMVSIRSNGRDSRLVSNLPVNLSFSCSWMNQPLV